MASIPKKVTERLVDGIKKFQPIVSRQKAADVGEADTVILVTSVLEEVFGYDKFNWGSPDLCANVNERICG